MVVSRLGLQPAIRYMIIHVAITILEHVQLGLDRHALEIGILERAGRRVGLDRVRAGAVPGDDAGHKGSVAVRVLALARALDPLAKRGVTPVHARIIDVDEYPLPGQVKVIRARHLGHRSIIVRLRLENLNTQTRPRDVIGQTARPVPLKSLHLGQTGQGGQFVGGHAGHELGPERRAILRQHLDAELGQAIGRGRLAVREQHHVEQRPLRQRLAGERHLEQLHLQFVIRLERQHRLRAGPVGQTRRAVGIHPHEVGVIGNVRDDFAAARGDVPPERRRGRAARLGDVRQRIAGGFEFSGDCQPGAKRGVDEGVSQQHRCLVADEFADRRVGVFQPKRERVVRGNRHRQRNGGRLGKAGGRCRWRLAKRQPGR